MTHNVPRLLGLDLGTSGFRAQIVCQGKIVSSAYQSRIDQHAQRLTLQPTEQAVQDWHLMLEALLKPLQPHLSRIDGIIADATSSSVLGLDAHCHVIEPALMYNDQRATGEAIYYQKLIAKESAAQGSHASLAKALWLVKHQQACHIWHQLDWLNAQFLDQPLDQSDINTQLKMGADPVSLTWPKSINDLATWPLAQLVLPGTPLGRIGKAARDRWGFSDHCQVYAGTTDSIAAFLATPASRIGDLVISMGSTLAFKVLSDRPINRAQEGIYSHRLGKHWLVGGASNAGGAIYQHRFSLDDLSALSQALAGQAAPALARYPLTQIGERFPYLDPNYPATDFSDLNDEQAFLSMTEGLVALEQTVYNQFAQLGIKVNRIFSLGGGLHNAAWQIRRHQAFGDKLHRLPQADAAQHSAAFGVTRLITEQF